MSSMKHAAYILKQLHPKGNDDLDIAEFGICLGNTGHELMQYLKEYDCHFNKFWLFDSFEGLPDNNEGAENWTKGQFNMQQIFNADVESIKSTLHKYIYNGFMPIEFIASWYSDLTKEHAAKMRPISFCHIDSDLYISAMQAMEFMIQNNLFAKDCLLQFDDWSYGGEYGRDHEGKAFYDITQKYGLKWEVCESIYLDKTSNCSFILR